MSQDRDRAINVSGFREDPGTQVCGYLSPFQERSPSPLATHRSTTLFRTSRNHVSVSGTCQGSLPTEHTHQYHAWVVYVDPRQLLSSQIYFVMGSLPCQKRDRGCSSWGSICFVGTVTDIGRFRLYLNVLIYV